MAVAALTLASCGIFGDDGPVRVAAIGALHRNPDRVSAPPSPPDQLLIEAVGQGLVTVSAEGQIDAGLAERWTVIDDGRSYIFRLRDARWADGQPVRAGEIAAALRQRIASSKLRPSMRGEFYSIRQIRAMTSRVIEIQLRQPRPDLLELLSQPDMGFSRNGRGWGPLRPEWAGGTVRLFAVDPPGAEKDAPSADEPSAMMWDASTAAAAAQFAEDRVDAVIGGTFNGWPALAASQTPEAAIQIDPVDGLFGLAIVGTQGLVADQQGRNAIAMALNRSRMLEALGIPGWQPRVTLRAEPNGQQRAAISPVYPAWADLSVADRQAQARDLVQAWRQRNGGNRPILRIAMPSGAGARMLFAWMRVDLASVGITARSVPAAADAELRLIDEVAPSRDPAWYARRLACGRGISCAEATRTLIPAIDTQPTAAERANAIIAAEDAMTRHMGFIPIAAPVRWSLRGDRASGLVANGRGMHSLNRLRPSPR